MSAYHAGSLADNRTPVGSGLAPSSQVAPDFLHFSRHPLHHLFLSCWLEPARQEISYLSRIRRVGFGHYVTRALPFPI
jgi:hypothetical protein